MDDVRRTERLQVMLEEEELKAIDDWRFTNRLPTRAAAIRELLRRGLTAGDIGIPEDTQHVRSGDFRVTDRAK